MAATEVEALCDHTVDLSLPVLLTNALIGRQPWHIPMKVVVIWLPYYKKPSRKLWSSSSLAHGSTVLIMGDANQRVHAGVMGRIICVFCPVGSEAAAERIFSVQHHHQHQDH